MSENFIESNDPHPCWICGKPTIHIEINFEAPLHPECEWAANEQYFTALLAGDIEYADGVLMLL